MLLLTSTSDKLQVITGSAVSTMHVHASWLDYNAGNVTPGRTNTQITGAATTDVVAAPAASTQRNVQTLTIRNNHASSSNAITVQHTDGSTVAELAKYTLLAGETLEWLDGVGFRVLDASGNVKSGLTFGQSVVDVFTTTGANTWTKRPGARAVYVICIGAGGGGGAGRRGAAASVRCGGGGGAAGGYGSQLFDAALLGATETVTIPTGGAGATGQTVDSTDGASGTAGSATKFGGKFKAAGGRGGAGGTATTGTGGAAPLGWPDAWALGTFGQGGAASGTGGVGGQGVGSEIPPSGGGAGGGITSGNTANNGGAGGPVGDTTDSANFTGYQTLIAGGLAGTVGAGDNGGNGNAAPVGSAIGGSGGGGGAGDAAAVGGNGGTGGKYGAGGGGGGASVNGQTSGAGGAGADGICVVTTFF